MKKIILSLLILFVLLLFSCSEDASKNDIYIAKGDRAVINSSKGIIKYDFGEGSFNPLTVTANIILAPNEALKNAGNSTEIIFKSDSPGIYSFNFLNYIIIKIDSLAYKSATGNLEISEYGNTGNLIKGSFSGEFKNSETNQTMTITVSQFNVVRK